tara:strand:+ start:211 stop:1140 length:930 start_codon:yes stop_codon:yes gene_type:complete
MKISAIIPAYNVEKYINRSINSALNQTYKPFEIIVIDDGSSDNTAKLVKDYENDVRYIFQANQGSSSARNLGIEKAKGDWIAFLDSDDEWIETHLENFVKTHKLYPEIKWYGAPYRMLDQESKKEAFKIKKSHLNQLDKHVVFDDYMMAFPPRAYLSSPTMIIHKSVFEEVGYFDITKKTAVDLDMWFRIGLEFVKIGYTYKEGAIVYRRKFSLTANKIWNPTKAIKRFEDCENMAKELGPNYVIRVEPRIMYWVINLMKDCIRRHDIKTLKEIKEKYYSRLIIKYKAILLFTAHFAFLLNIIKKIKNN